MEFEWDLQKSASNLVKHGIDFEKARELWLDPNQIELDSGYIGETRTKFVSQLDGKIWTAIVTFRDSRFRIISVRRAQKSEVRFYENNKR